MIPETHMKLCMADSNFLEKNSFSSKSWKMDQKWTKNGPKTGVFEFIEKFGN